MKKNLNYLLTNLPTNLLTQKEIAQGNESDFIPQNRCAMTNTLSRGSKTHIRSLRTPPSHKERGGFLQFAKETDKVSSPFTPHSSLKHENPSPSIPLPRRGKKATFTKPSRGMSVSERRTIINENRAFRVDCERCRFTRGAAFTLAEVLITLAIVGIVAAIVLPGLIYDIQDRHFKALWKKTYSDVQKAYQQAFIEEPEAGYVIGGGGMGGTTSKDKAHEIYKRTFSNMKTLSYCVEPPIFGYHPCTHVDKHYEASPKCKSLNGDYDARCASDGSAGYALLPNGVKIYAGAYQWNYPKFLVDVNGPKKGPNVVGRDMFLIFLYRGRVVPGGSPAGSGDSYNLGCDRSKSSYTPFCASTLVGAGCGYKYLYE